MRYEKSNSAATQYKYSDEEFKILRVSGRGRPLNYPETLKPLYQKQLLISKTKKKKVLMKLCSTKAIPKNLIIGIKIFQAIYKKKDESQVRVVSLVYSTYSYIEKCGNINTCYHLLETANHRLKQYPVAILYI